MVIPKLLVAHGEWEIATRAAYRSRLLGQSASGRCVGIRTRGLVRIVA